MENPRNTFTLPLWLDVFPQAKIIHLHRGGMDVALSLRRRGRRELHLQRLYRKLRILHWVRPKRGGFVHSVRCDDLNGSLALWREYLEQGKRHVGRLRDRAFDVSFESLVREPGETLAAHSQFCDLPVDPAAIERASRQINPSVLSPDDEFHLCSPAVPSS